MKDPASIVAGWKRRLVAMADNPAYVYSDTPRELIEQHYRDLTHFQGYPEAEIAATEARLAVQFPRVFRQYLLEMARAPGALFMGNDLAGLDELEQYQANALELLAGTDPALTLPREATVFLSHQGYNFCYVLAVGGFDGPVLNWCETEREPQQLAADFAAFVDNYLQGMEHTDRVARDNGGYYMTLHSGGGSTQTYPALSSGDRPLDSLPRRRWWQFWRT